MTVRRVVIVIVPSVVTAPDPVVRSGTRLRDRSAATAMHVRSAATTMRALVGMATRARFAVMAIVLTGPAISVRSVVTVTRVRTVPATHGLFAAMVTRVRVAMVTHAPSVVRGTLAPTVRKVSGRLVVTATPGLSAVTTAVPGPEAIVMRVRSVGMRRGETPLAATADIAGRAIVVPARAPRVASIAMARATPVPRRIDASADRNCPRRSRHVTFPVLLATN